MTPKFPNRPLTPEEKQLQEALYAELFSGRQKPKSKPIGKRKRKSAARVKVKR